MRRSLAPCLATLLVVSCAGTEPLPVPTTGDDVARFMASSPQGHIRSLDDLALAGQIQRVESTSHDTFAIELLCRKPNENGQTLWVGVLPQLDATELQVGDIVRVRGLLGPTLPDLQAFTDAPLCMLAWGLMNQRTMNGHTVPGSEEAFQRWVKGEVPKGKWHEQ